MNLETSEELNNMADFNKLEDIFNDDFFIEHLKEQPKLVEKAQDPVIQSFLEIVEFYRENGREPEQKKIGRERTLFNKLKSYRLDKELATKVKYLDEFNLLGQNDENDLSNDKLNNSVCESKMIYDMGNLEKNFDNLDAICEDMDNFDEIFLDNGDYDSELEKSLLDTSRYATYKQRRIQPRDYAVIKKLDDFEQYDRMFKNIHSDITSGKRELIPIINEGESSANINAGDYFIVNGQMLFVESIGDQEVVVNKKGTATKNAKMKVIYENGMYHEKLRRNSLAADFRRKQSFKVSEIISGNSEFDKIRDVVTGNIYILQSLSSDSKIQSIPNFYKVGVTKNTVEQRISNAKNEETYLYSDVAIVTSWQVANVNAEKLEKAIHNVISDYRVEIEIPMPNGRMYRPREWFSIEFEKLEKVINDIILKLQMSIMK